MTNSKLKTEVVFLGGNNKDRIGGNCILVEHTNTKGQTTRIMMDMGSVFTPYHSGFDEAFADYRQYFDVIDKKTGVVTPAIKKVDMVLFTHLHQDHIGGLMHAENLGIQLPQIKASRNTRNFIRLCARENGFLLPEITSMKSGEIIHVSPDLEIETFDVAHSAVDSLGFHILCKNEGKPVTGLINHGDFFTEENMPIGKGFDKKAYNQLISHKLTTHALMDSTSITDDTKERLSFEEAVTNTLGVIKQNPGKQIISPVISRSLQNIAIDIEVARRLNRKICLDGKWLKIAFEAMQLSGYNNFDDVIYKASLQEYLRETPINNRYIVNTGAFAQGMQEYHNNEGKGNMIAMASLTKMALDLHEHLSFDSNTLLLSRQRIIGEINGITGLEILNLAASKGATIACSPSPEVDGKFQTVAMQGSGHLNQLALQTLITKGITYIPIHGNAAQLNETAEIIKKNRGKAFVAENMDQLSLSSNSIKSLGKADTMHWIAVENITPDPLNLDNIVPMEGKKRYCLVDENYQVVEEIKEVDNPKYKSFRKSSGDTMKEKAVKKFENTPSKRSNKEEKAWRAKYTEKKKNMGR